MTADRKQLSVLGAMAADSLAQHPSLEKYAGIVRQLARALREAPAADDVGSGVCALPGCGEPLAPSGRGRPPVYHSDGCRKAAWRGRKRDEMRA